MIALTCKRQNDFVEMTLLIDNPFRDDSAVQAKSGKVSYRNFIQELSITSNDRVLLTAQFNPAMAAHPNFVRYCSGWADEAHGAPTLHACGEPPPLPSPSPSYGRTGTCTSKPNTVKGAR